MIFIKNIFEEVTNACKVCTCFAISPCEQHYVMQCTSNHSDPATEGHRSIQSSVCKIRIFAIIKGGDKTTLSEKIQADISKYIFHNARVNWIILHSVEMVNIFLLLTEIIKN